MPDAPNIALRQHRKRIAITGDIPAKVWQSIEGEIKRASVFSARVINGEHVAKLWELTGSLLQPQPADRVHENGLPVLEGDTWLTAKRKAQAWLQSTGYEPAPGEAGTITDLSSDARVQLQLQTLTETAQGLGQMMQGQQEDILWAFPCQELYRAYQRKEERPWGERWLFAARIAEDGIAARVYITNDGRMVARKDSKIWTYLGTLWDDSLGNPYPPFAFRSGMWVKDIDRQEAIALEIIPRDAVVAKTVLPDLTQNLSTRTRDVGWQVIDALMKSLGSGWERDENGVIRRTT